MEQGSYSEQSSPGSPMDRHIVKVQNQPHDEEFALSEEESSDDAASEADPPPAQARQSSRGSMQSPASQMHDRESSEGSYPQAPMQARRTTSAAGSQRSSDGRPSGSAHRAPSSGTERSEPETERNEPDMEEQSEESDESSDEETSPVGPPGSARIYNAAEYDHLQVTEEIRDLFQYIGRYKPHNIELDGKLKPFIPDYIPAIGDIDEFIKVPRPDGQPDYLGLKVLDEPAAQQSDPTVLNLQLRSLSKQSNLQPMPVSSIEAADKNPKKISAWINSINDLHKSKPPPHVSYSKPMPDIEKLMQEWPQEFEELLEKVQLPNADLDVDLRTFVQIACALLDIPVYNNLVESLHVMYTLFIEFKNNPHFAAATGGNEWAAQTG